MRRYSESNETFEQLISMKKVDTKVLANAHYYKGESYRNLKKYNQAVESFQKSTEINLTDPGKTSNLHYPTYLIYERCGHLLHDLKRFVKNLQKIKNLIFLLIHKI